MLTLSKDNLVGRILLGLAPATVPTAEGLASSQSYIDCRDTVSLRFSGPRLNY